MRTHAIAAGYPIMTLKLEPGHVRRSSLLAAVLALMVGHGAVAPQAVAQTPSTDNELSLITSFHNFGPDAAEGGGGAMQGWPGAELPGGAPQYVRGANGSFLYVPIRGKYADRTSGVSGVGPSLARVQPVLSHYERVYLPLALTGRAGMPHQEKAGSVVQRPNGDLVGAISPRYSDSEREAEIGEGVLYRTEFDGANGAVIVSTVGRLNYPLGPLVVDAAGSVYGVDLGPSGNGRVFKLDAANVLSIVHTFAAGPAGRKQIPGGMTLGSDGWLYGVTAYPRGIPGTTGIPTGADTPTGTLYRVDPGRPASFEVLHTFTLQHGEILSTAPGNNMVYDSGYTPDRSWLVEGPDGWLYGTTSVGNCATARTPETVTPTNGPPQNPICGHSYGWASYYALPYPHYDVPWNVHGTVYRMRKDGVGGIQVLHRFSGTDGSTPSGELTVGTDGAIYGTAAGGGAFSSYGAAKRITDTDRPFPSTCPADRLQAGQCEQKVGDGVLYRIWPGRIVVGDDGAVSQGGFELVQHFEKAKTGKTPIGVRAASDGRIYGATLYGGAGWTDMRSQEYQDDRYGTLFAYGPKAGASVTLTVSPAVSTAGQRVALTWTSTQTRDCTATSSHADWSGAVEPQGTHEFYPASGVYTYFVSCTDSLSNLRVSSGVQTLRVDAQAGGNDGNEVSYGNGGALGLGLLSALGLLAWRARRSPGSRLQL